MPNAEFLETYPLYRKLKLAVPNTMDRIPKVRINMSCAECKEIRTFSMINEYHDAFRYSNAPSEDQIIEAKYQCVSCNSFTRYFAIKISVDLTNISKVGQLPPWETKINNDVAAMLGSHKDYLQKGMISESQGYGIGAFSYYRRIVEETIDELLSEVEKIIPESERALFSEALKKVKNTRVTAEKIELVQDLLPPILRPDNMNPLSLLHGVLSEGLHAESDERCLKLAAEVREILTFLAAQIATASRSARTFTEKMRTLLQKRDQAKPDT